MNPVSSVVILFCHGYLVYCAPGHVRSRESVKPPRDSVFTLNSSWQETVFSCFQRGPGIWILQKQLNNWMGPNSYVVRTYFHALNCWKKSPESKWKLRIWWPPQCFWSSARFANQIGNSDPASYPRSSLHKFPAINYHLHKETSKQKRGLPNLVDRIP